MIGRIFVGLVSVAIILATWAARPHDVADASPITSESASIYAYVLPPDNATVTALDTAYGDLVAAMRPHGCSGCHAPNLASGGRRARIRHAVQLLDTRREIQSMIEANLMPPETGDRVAGIADDAIRAELLRRARVFRVLGDAAVANW